MEKRNCPKLECGSLDYWYDAKNRTLQIITDYPETGTEGGVIYTGTISFDRLNTFLSAYLYKEFTTLDLAMHIGRVGSNYGSMFTAILIDCKVVEKIKRGKYKVIGLL